MEGCGWKVTDGLVVIGTRLAHGNTNYALALRSMSASHRRVYFGIN